MQVLSFHRQLGQPGKESVLPTALFDGRVYDYYDIKATSTEDDRVLYAFFAAGRWTCFIGRALTAHPERPERRETHGLRAVSAG